MRKYRKVYKVIAIIPSKKRNTAGKAVRVLEHLVDKIVVMSQNAVVDYVPANTKIIERPEDGLAANRNAGLIYAIDGGYDIMFQIDDDVKFKPETIQKMLHIFYTEPDIAGVGSDASMLAYWSRSLVTNRPYKITGVISQLWAVRTTKAVMAIDKWRCPAFDVGTMEDIRFSLKLWTMGLPVVRLVDPELCHTPFIPRLKKGEEQGGQTVADRNATMEEAVEKMQEFVGPHGVLRFCKLQEKDGQLGYRIGYDYQNMIVNSFIRNGNIGYCDSKGRRL